MNALAARVSGLHAMVRRPPGLYAAARRFIKQFSDLDLEGRQALQEQRLRWLLRKTGRSEQVLQDLPLTEKADLRRAPQEYGRSSILPVSRGATSGTSGEPLKVSRSLGAVVFEQASVDWIVAQTGHDLARDRVAVLRGSDFSGLAPGADVGVRSEGGRVLTLPTNDLSPDTFPQFIAALQAFRPRILHAYPSSVQYLAELAANRGADLDIPVILTSSEVFSPAARRKVAATFNARVVDFYGQAERVAAAYSNEPDQYRFLPAYGITELIADQAGWQIVGTNLHNTSQFLPRYKTGDMLLGEPTAGEMAEIVAGISPFEGIEGRRDDALVGRDGRRFIAINHVPRGLERYGRWQFIQERPNQAVVRLAGWSPEVENVTEPVLERVRLKVPADFTLEIQFAQSLERGPSGKTPFIIKRF